MSTVSVVIPTLNEARNLEYVLPALPADLHEVLIVDGNSLDNTVEVARLLRPDVRIVYEPKKGKGAALRAGFAAATGDIIVAMDADGSSDPNELPAFISPLMHGCDFAKGSRFLPGGGSADITGVRALGNYVFVGLVRILFGGRYTDLCYGYNAFWRGVLPLLHLQCDGFEIETEMNVRALVAGLRVVEVPSFEHPRRHGASSLHAFRDGWRVLQTILVERFVRPRASQRPRLAVMPPAGRPVVGTPLSTLHGVATSVLIADESLDQMEVAAEAGALPQPDGGRVESFAADSSMAPTAGTGGDGEKLR